MSAIDNAFIRAYTTDKTPAASAMEGVSPIQAPAATAQATASPLVAARQIPPPIAPMSLAAARAARAATQLGAVASEATSTEPIHMPLKPAATPAPHFNPSSFAVAPSNTSAPLEPSIGPAAFRADLPTTAEPAQPPRAAYEVDHFEWPALCDTLLTDLAGGLDHLAGELVTESALGRKVIAITSLRRGEGRTTLVLALARRLAVSGAKVLLADADVESPQLAGRLGLDIEQGWDETAADGATPWDTMIESLADQLTVLPLAARRGSALRRRGSGEGVAAARGRYETLRPHFDLVLVDAGPLDPAAMGSRTDSASLAGCDAALLICDARQTKPAQLADAQRRLLDASVTPLGVVENFCPASV